MRKLAAAAAAALMISAATQALSAEVVTYSYDARGRLIQVVRNGVTTTYTYDAAGNRVRVTVTGAP